MNGSYTNINFQKIIKDKLHEKIIIECGSRDCLDAIDMLKTYRPKKIYSFECNPESISVCKKHIEHIAEIELLEFAVSDKNGMIDFFATDMNKSKDKNIGASSALFHNGGQNDFIQKKIQTNAITLETFINNRQLDNHIGLLCLDLQQYELVALNGLGEKIKNIDFIITEVNFENYYQQGAMFDDINHMLNFHDFHLVDVSERHNFFNRIAFTNALYQKNK